MAATAHHKLYTIGNAGASRQMYVDEMHRLGIRTFADVRGNPRAGRHSDLHKSKELSKAFAAASIAYVYWGDRLGEDEAEKFDIQALRLVLKGLLATVQQPVCILGHLAEALKCHRLQIAEAARLEGHEVWHLHWKDHMQVQLSSHESVYSESTSHTEFFSACMRQHLVTKAEHEQAGHPLPVLSWDQMNAEVLNNGISYRLALPFDTEILWYPKWLDESHADRLLEILKAIPLEYPTYTFAQSNGIDQKIKSKRGVARYCEEFGQRHQQVSSSNDVEARSFEPWTRELITDVERASESVFNCVWVNEYSNGRVGITWHTDLGHLGLGPNPIIGSLSVGAARSFLFKSKRPLGNGGLCQIAFPLRHGSLIVMGRNSQTHWLHSVPAEDADGLRFNLTFRFYARQGEQLHVRNERSHLDAAGAEIDRTSNELSTEAVAKPSELAPRRSRWNRETRLRPSPALQVPAAQNRGCHSERSTPELPRGQACVQFPAGDQLKARSLAAASGPSDAEVKSACKALLCQGVDGVEHAQCRWESQQGAIAQKGVAACTVKGKESANVQVASSSATSSSLQHQPVTVDRKRALRRNHRNDGA